MANPAFSTRYKLSDGRYAVDVTEAKTLTAADSGIVQNTIATGVVFTVPATATQGAWTVRDGGVKTTGGPAGAVVSAAIPTVDPNGSDTLAGFNVSGTAADGKYLQNTGGKFGDEISFQNTAATDGGIVTESKGDWLREA